MAKKPLLIKIEITKDKGDAEINGKGTEIIEAIALLLLESDDLLLFMKAAIQVVEACKNENN